MLHTGSRMPQFCSQAVTEHANKLSKQQPGERGSFSKELMRPAEERPAWHGERLWPVYTGFSLGGGARSLPDHSQRWLEDQGAWETPVGEGPPGLREGLARSAPWMVCCCLDRACCRKSAPLYLEPCSWPWTMITETPVVVLFCLGSALLKCCFSLPVTSACILFSWDASSDTQG